MDDSSVAGCAAALDRRHETMPGRGTARRLGPVGHIPVGPVESRSRKLEWQSGQLTKRRSPFPTPKCRSSQRRRVRCNPLFREPLSARAGFELHVVRLEQSYPVSLVENIVLEHDGVLERRDITVVSVPVLIPATDNDHRDQPTEPFEL